MEAFAEAYSPGPHSAQAVAPDAFENVPAPHGAHPLAPPDAPKNPAAHGAHAVDPAAAANDPATHAEHASPSAPAENDPAPHVAHAYADVMTPPGRHRHRPLPVAPLVKALASHGRHAVALPLEYELTGHGTCGVVLSGQKCPIPHVAHAVAPPTATNEPLAHGRHDDIPDPFANVPAAHVAHVDSPPPAENVPALHAIAAPARHIDPAWHAAQVCGAPAEGWGWWLSSSSSKRGAVVVMPRVKVWRTVIMSAAAGWNPFIHRAGNPNRFFGQVGSRTARGRCFQPAGWRSSLVGPRASSAWRFFVLRR